MPREIEQELKQIAETYHVRIFGNIKKDEGVWPVIVGQEPPQIKKPCSNCKAIWQENHSCPDALQMKVSSGIKLGDKYKDGNTTH